MLAVDKGGFLQPRISDHRSLHSRACKVGAGHSHFIKASAIQPRAYKPSSVHPRRMEICLLHPRIREIRMVKIEKRDIRSPQVCSLQVEAKATATAGQAPFFDSDVVCFPPPDDVEGGLYVNPWSA